MPHRQRPLKDAVKQAMAAISAKDWGQALDAVQQSGTSPEQDSGLAYAAGLAEAALGRDPFDPDRLANGVRLLSLAWRDGKRERELVWSLVETQFNIGSHAEAAEVLTAYMEETSDPDERVRAGAFLAMIGDRDKEFETAVEAHSRGLGGLGRSARSDVRFESYVHAHVSSAYGRARRGEQWIREARGAWEAVPPDERSLEMATRLLQGAAMATDAQQTGHEHAIKLGEELIPFVAARGVATPDNARTSAGFHEALFWLHCRIGDEKRAAESLHSVREVIARVRRGSRGESQATEWTEVLHVLVHNLGCVCRYLGYRQEALALLREAVQVAPRPNGPSFYSLAALTLETGGTREESLAWFKRMADDPSWAYGGSCHVAAEGFESDPAFSQVRHDPEFIAALRAMRRRS